MKAFLAYLWCRRTTTLGYIGVIISVMELNPDTVGSWVSAPKRGTLLLLFAMTNAAIGHYNNRRNNEDQGK